MSLTEFKEKAKKVLIIAGSIIGSFLLLLAGVFTGSKITESKAEKEAEKEKEKIKDEIKEKDPDEIIADSGNVDAVNSAIEINKEEFRERIRDRLNGKLHRDGSE